MKYEILEKFMVQSGNYTLKDLVMVKRAYQYAETMHSGQLRQSGEPYIVHPLHVALILAELHADTDTICAGLLHDTLEDTQATKEELVHEFNKDIANLVDGVTKLAKMNFNSKQAEELANHRKIIAGITEDVRIIIIKLADRLHNMRTLQYKTVEKQKENALETMEIFAPLAFHLGAYHIKNELEDLSLKYLKPDSYQEVYDKRIQIENENWNGQQEMIYKIRTSLKEHEIPVTLKKRTKNVYGIYKKLTEGEKLCDIHDLIVLKVIVDEIDNCYRSLGYIHQLYRPINDKFKDYICNPKTNRYQSLHTTLFGENERLVQAQIRTAQMDQIASYGLTAYWNYEKGNAREVLQLKLKENYQFFYSLLHLKRKFSDNLAFFTQVKQELFDDRVYVYTTKGDVIELPKGSTPIDFAYRIHTEIGNQMVGALVNDHEVAVDYQLKNNDRVKILTSETSLGPDSNWEQYAKTSYAKSKIKSARHKLRK